MDTGFGSNDNDMFPDNISLTQTPLLPEYEEKEEGPILSSLAEFIIEIIFYVTLCILIGCFGTVANVINIVVYFRQGVLSCGSNLNLFSLSVADLGVSFTTFLQGVGYAVVTADIPDLLWDPFAIIYLTIGWPGMMFAMANRLLTAYVAFERCLCVVLPFRVKRLFTIRRSLFHITIIYAYSVLSHVPIYVVHRFGFEMQENTNVSKLVLFYTADREVVHSFVFFVNYLVVSIATVVIVFVCTAVTGTHVITSKEWRKSVNAVAGETIHNTRVSTFVNDDEPSPRNCAKSKGKKTTNNTMDKESKLVKMITMISLVYLLCYLPDLLLIVVKAIDKRIHLDGSYFRLAQLIYAFAFVLTVLNSSVNIFIYYTMSSRYRKEFRNLFGMSCANDS